MHDMYKSNDCGCSPRPEHDDKKDKFCDFDSTCCGDGLVRQRETIRITATNTPQTVYIADGEGDTNAKVKIKNLSSTNPIVVSPTIPIFLPVIQLEPNGELLISSFLLQRIDINTPDAGATANVLLCFELLVCTPCGGSPRNGRLTTDVNTDSKE